MLANPIAVHRWVATLLPAFELLIFVYAAYVITGEVAINHFINPPLGSSHPARPGAAIAILILFYLLLIILLVSLYRVLYVIYTDAGYLPMPNDHPNHRSNKSEGGENGEVELGRPIHMNADDPADVYEKDAFICSASGWPRWCDRCKTWKPDRTHHSSDVGRCVRGLDHFCPWAGGIVSEANHKFFNQFCMWTALFCILVVVVDAVVIAELRQDGLTGGHKFITVAVLLALAALFGLFTTAMTVTHFGYALGNQTSVEWLQSKTTNWVAVYVGSPKEYPGTSANIVSYPMSRTGQEPTRAFAILEVPGGKNPFDLGMLENWRSLMGNQPWDWFLPIRKSPVVSRIQKGGSRQDYKLSRDVEQLKEAWISHHTKSS